MFIDAGVPGPELHSISAVWVGHGWTGGNGDGDRAPGTPMDVDPAPRLKLVGSLGTRFSMFCLFCQAQLPPTVSLGSAAVPWHRFDVAF